jgi:DNA repair exonuclease SbcCD ATPase subunit
MRAGRLARLAAVALIAFPGVHAQDTTEARLREALRATAEKLHATEADLAQQQLATAAAERERDALKQAPRAAHVDGAQAAALQHRLAAAAAELAQAQSDGQKWQAEQQASAQALQHKETERAALADQVTQLRARAERCVADDGAVYGTAREIAALYRDPKFLGPVRSHHLWPLGFDRVREENRVRALEDRLSDQLAQAQRCRTDAPSAQPASATIATPATPTPPAEQAQ